MSKRNQWEKGELNYGKSKNKKLSYKDALFDNTRTDVVKHIDFIKTNEGEYVVGGNKLKVGLPIVLEGKDYRFNGVISSILSVEETNNSQDLLENKDNE